MKTLFAALIVLCVSQWAYAGPAPISDRSAPLAPTVVLVSGAAPATHAAAPRWNHKRGTIELCAQRGDKNCPAVTIPRGITRIIGIISSDQIPGVPNGFVVLSRKGQSSMNSYLCATGVDSPDKLRCQRMSLPDPTLGPIDPDVAKAIFQNTVSVLLNPRTGSTGMNRTDLIDVGGGCAYDEETGEVTCAGGGGGPEPSGGGPETSEPGPSTDIPGTGSPPEPSSPESLAGPYIAEMEADTEAEFADVASKYACNSEAQCNVVIARCREDCNDRGIQAGGVCAAMGAIVGTLPSGLAKAAALLVVGACGYNVMDKVIACKTICTAIHP